MIVKIEVMGNGYVVSVEHNVPALCSSAVFNTMSDMLKYIRDVMPHRDGSLK